MMEADQEVILAQEAEVQEDKTKQIFLKGGLKMTAFFIVTLYVGKQAKNMIRLPLNYIK